MYLLVLLVILDNLGFLEPLVLDQVKQKCYIDVSEKGTEAAAVTSAQIRLTADKYGEGVADDALAFVTVEILDAEGNLCPSADNLVHFEVTSGASIAGTDNGNPVSMERFKANRRKAFNGKCLVVLEALEKGRTTLTATSEGITKSTVSIEFER